MAVLPGPPAQPGVIWHQHCRARNHRSIRSPVGSAPDAQNCDPVLVRVFELAQRDRPAEGSSILGMNVVVNDMTQPLELAVAVAAMVVMSVLLPV